MFFAGEIPAGRARGRRPQRLATATTGHGGIPSLLHLEYRTKKLCALVESIGGSTAHFVEGLKVNQRQGINMPYFLPNRYVMEVNTFNWRRCHCDVGLPYPWDSIWGRTTFETAVVLPPPQAIHDVERGNYDLMISM